ncbi:MAG: hypothetical protein ABW065_04985 [Solirubrobacterales bacterium]
MIRPDAVLPREPGPRGGWLGPLVLSAGAGLLLCSLANVLSRGTEGSAMALYWLGMIVIAAPIFYRLTGREASTGERLALVCLLGLALFGVKVVRDAPIFTFSDELIHAFNANQIGLHDHLFHANPVLKVTPYYPGLEGATSALMKITGLSSYAAGTFVVGAARLTLVTALFFLFLRVSGSARTAGLAAAIYAGNFNFLFWGAQFSYESVALPLLLVVMMILATRESTPREALREWALPLCLGIAAIVVTHHLTAYALVAVLAGLSLTIWLLKRSWEAPNPWPYAIGAAVLVAFWLIVVASATLGYLSTPLSNAFDAIGNTIGGESPPRGLFQGNTTVGVTPIGARAVALGAIVLMALALPLGLLQLWQRQRRNPFVILFGLASLAFFVSLLLRLAPAAWETGNRASEFFFIGLAFVLASAGIQNWKPRGSAVLGRLAVTAALAAILVGGAISGWPWDSQLARPLRVATGDGGSIVSPPLAMAEWARRQVPDGKFAAQTADANLLLAQADKDVATGPNPNVEDTLAEPALAPWQLQMLRENDLRYVVSDAREVSADGLRGYYFPVDDADEPLFPAAAVTKFGKVPGSARVYSNGTITVYDMEAGR